MFYRLRRRVPVQLKLAASALVLLAVLTALFLVLGRPMPTPELASRTTERQHLWGETVTLAQGEVALQEAERSRYPDLHWLVRRSGALYALSLIERVGPLWRQYRFLPLGLSEEEPLVGYVVGEGFTSRGDHAYLEEYLLVAVCIDPDVVRLEGEYCQVPAALREDSDAAFRRYGSSLFFAQAGSGVWTGRGVARESQLGESYSTAVRPRGYAADGRLIATF